MPNRLAPLRWRNLAGPRKAILSLCVTQRLSHFQVLFYTTSHNVELWQFVSWGLAFGSESRVFLCFHFTNSLILSLMTFLHERYTFLLRRKKLILRVVNKDDLFALSEIAWQSLPILTDYNIPSHGRGKKMCPVYLQGHCSFFQTRQIMLSLQ